MKKVLVLGMKASGHSAVALLTKKGIEVRRYDDNLEFSDNWKSRRSEALNSLDGVCVSPGVPNNHELIIEAKARKIQIFSELELGINSLDSNIIMITGTNGKTTTVDMVERGLMLAGMKCKAMGNIGYPVSQVALDNVIYDHAIIEASSFQLEHVKKIKANIAVVLNLAPDHIDRYKGFTEYINAKKNIFLNQDENDHAILNYDLKQTRELVKATKAKPIFVSTRTIIGDFNLANDAFYFNKDKLVNFRECRIKGEHNRFNMLVALNILHLLGCTRSDYVKLIKEYKTLPHRVEYVSTINGKRFYNDSKGTNIAACTAAINLLSGAKIGLILGGSDKREDFCDFFDQMSKDVKHVVVTGANDVKIIGAAMKVGFQEIEIAKDLNIAVSKLIQMNNIDTILFSPACASFDRFSSYQERGDRFKELVYGLKA
ncbi:MAG: UDP-N-acetylmuramoyl-L-alanine--D-glutamate ligase [Christensenellaceae bacterium]|jgi:UDP-N-acetylmuramoylalanine--D-glutamate ligase|nr:UDP-N-acetylmuramoyl-L-alanine--D-glutamate ligase [Christensenellaceae bacterium]